MALSKRDRVAAALSGGKVDRPPVSAWRHFLPQERNERDFVEAGVAFTRVNDWDWLKINPRATYYAEIFGNAYDYDSYSGVVPRRVSGPLEKAADLSRLTPAPASHPVIEEQLRVVASLRKALPEVPLIQTVFSPLSVLNFLSARGDPGTDFATLQGFLRDHAEAARDALSAITETLRAYATRLLSAGADGIFFAIVRLARDGVLSHEEYERFEKPFDLEVLGGVREASFNVLHTCGPAVFFDAAEDYPVHAVNWAAGSGGNPTVAQALLFLDKAVMGGVDEGLFSTADTREQISRQAAEVIRAASSGRFLLSPGCAVDPHAPSASLAVLRASVDSLPAS
jgi:uroporphyrinogen decarboxylase